jgi:hypothetical protein
MMDLFVLACDMDTVFAVLFWLGILKSSTVGYILGPFWTLAIWSVFYNICLNRYMMQCLLICICPNIYINMCTRLTFH